MNPTLNRCRPSYGAAPHQRIITNVYQCYRIKTCFQIFPKAYQVYIWRHWSPPAEQKCQLGGSKDGLDKCYPLSVFLVLHSYSFERLLIYR